MDGERDQETAGAAAAAGRPRHYPRIKNALVLVALLIGLQAALGIVAGFSGLATTPAVLGMVNLVSFAVVIGMAAKKAGTPLKSLFELKSPPVGVLVLIALTCVGLSIVMSEINNLVRTVLPMGDWWESFFRSLVHADHPVGTVLLLVVVAPLTEELLFRKILLDAFLEDYATPAAIIAASCLFGVVHLNPWQFVTGFLLGLYLSWLYHRTGALLPCLVGHAVFNALPVLTEIVLDFDIEGYSASSAEALRTASFQPVWFDVLGALLLSVGMLATHRRLKHRGSAAA